jgi:folylpolyglutamate synthase/dihydropteroate synthase
MTAANIPATPMPSLSAALSAAKDSPTLICGSLFLAGEALVALHAYPYSSTRFDPSEQLHPTS